MILDKSSYFMGDIVKGCCYVDVKEFESNKMKLIVEGIEYSKNNKERKYQCWYLIH